MPITSRIEPRTIVVAVLVSHDAAAWTIPGRSKFSSIQWATGAILGCVSKGLRHSPESTALLTASAPRTASLMIRSATNADGATTIKATSRTQLAAARLRFLTFDASHRWSGANKTASAKAHASAGKNGAASR